MKNIKSALIIGILAGLWVFFSLSVGSIGGVTLHAWPVFIIWGLFFAAGANNQAAVKVAITAIWGPIFGWLCVYFGATILGPIIGAPAGLGLLVFVLAAAIVIMMTDIPFFSFGPGAFACWAVFFATNFDFVGSVVLLLVGVFLGLLSVNLPKLFTSKPASKA